MLAGMRPVEGGDDAVPFERGAGAVIPDDPAPDRDERVFETGPGDRWRHGSGEDRRGRSALRPHRDSRCATTRAVRPRISPSIASCTDASAPESRLHVASSRIGVGATARTARASAVRSTNMVSPEPERPPGPTRRSPGISTDRSRQSGADGSATPGGSASSATTSGTRRCRWPIRPPMRHLDPRSDRDVLAPPVQALRAGRAARLSDRLGRIDGRAIPAIVACTAFTASAACRMASARLPAESWTL